MLSRMNIISVTTMTVNSFSNTTQTITIQLTSTGDSPTICPQNDVEYDTGTIVLTDHNYGTCNTGNMFRFHLGIV